jgi:hypothetical protein
MTLPTPIGFNESLEEYVSRCKINGHDCTCSVRKRYPQALNSNKLMPKDVLPRTGHTDSCPIGEAYLAWKQQGRKVWDVILASERLKKAKAEATNLPTGTA